MYADSAYIIKELNNKGMQRHGRLCKNIPGNPFIFCPGL